MLARRHAAGNRRPLQFNAAGITLIFHLPLLPHFVFFFFALRLSFIASDDLQFAATLLQLLSPSWQQEGENNVSGVTKILPASAGGRRREKKKFAAD